MSKSFTFYIMLLIEMNTIVFINVNRLKKFRDFLK